MGLRGPAPKPTVLEIAEGLPGKRKPSRREPKPREVSAAELEGDIPAGLGEGERRWWVYYAGMLGSMRVLTEADRTALIILTTASAEREENDEQLRRSGPIYKVPGGAVRVSPLFKVGMALRDRELKLLREFGLTPSARTRVQMVDAEDDNAALQRAMARPSQSETECSSIQ